MNATLLIGIGNDFRGDDAAGLLVTRAIQQEGLAGVTILESDGEALSLMEAWQGAGRLILVDAIQADKPVGSILRFDASEKAIPAQPFLCSTHAFNLAESIELARSLGRLPSTVVVHGIQGKNFEIGARISPSVLEAIEEVAQRVQNELR